MDENENVTSYLQIAFSSFIFAASISVLLYMFNNIISINHAIIDTTTNKKDLIIAIDDIEKLYTPAEAIFEIINCKENITFYVNGSILNSEGINLLKSKGSEGIQFATNSFDVRASARYAKYYNYDTNGQLCSIEYILKE